VSAEPDLGATEPWLVRDRDTYLADIEACARELRTGTSYEICLTNAARLPAPPDAYDFYRAFLRFGDLDVASASPERFLRITRASSRHCPAPRPENSAATSSVRAPGDHGYGHVHSHSHSHRRERAHATAAAPARRPRPHGTGIHYYSRGDSIP
jgi:hypothetical protein